MIASLFMLFSMNKNSYIVNHFFLEHLSPTGYNSGNNQKSPLQADLCLAQCLWEK